MFKIIMVNSHEHKCDMLSACIELFHENNRMRNINCESVNPQQNVFISKFCHQNGINKDFL